MLRQTDSHGLLEGHPHAFWPCKGRASADRNVVLGNIVRHITGQLVIFGLLNNAEATMIGNRLKNVATGQQALTQAWNARERDLTDGRAAVGLRDAALK